MEIMIPSHIKEAASMLSEQHLWVSKDRKIRINISRGSADLDDDGIGGRLGEYYHDYCKDINGFRCRYIKKRKIYKRQYGELRYFSKMMGHDLFTMFLLGAYEGRELIFTIQCIAEDSEHNMRIFENIADSLKVTKEEN
jgi:hypothetical protein